MLDDEIFPNYEQLQIVEKLVKTCYMDGLTDDYVNAVSYTHLTLPTKLEV